MYNSGTVHLWVLYGFVNHVQYNAWNGQHESEETKLSSTRKVVDNAVELSEAG